jgi:hypothetical protein
MLAPLFSARAQNNNPQFALSNGAIEKDPNGTKYRWVIGVGAVNTTSGGSTVVIGGSSTTGSTGNTSSNLIPADIRITTGTTVASLVELTRVSIDIPNNQPYTFTSDYILEADSGYSAQIYKRGSTSITYSESIAIHINPQGQVTGTGTADGSTISTENGDNNGLPVCWQGPTSVHVSGCIAQGVYYALFVPTSFLFSLSGQLLDWAMGFTLDSNSYKGSGATFVEQGWKIARDIANIMFIFILLWAGIGTILGNHNVNAKNTIKNVILVALLLNFSLFFARVVIDASNILGGVFYNNIGVNDTANVSNPWITDTKNVSVAIVSKFNPQSIFEQANTLKLTSQSGVPEAVGVNGAPPPGQFIIISLIMTVINCIGIWVFASVAFLFMARVAGLWILMIFAPIAFISLIMPSSGGKILGEMSFSSWWSKLISQAFVVPVFMFFMYLIIMFMNTNFFRDLGSDKTTTQIILGVLIPLLIIVTLLMRARKIALDMSGEIGGAVVKAGTALAGGAIGLAAGGYALAGRATLGRLGYNATQNQGLKDAAAKKGLSGMMARATLAASNKLATSTFDARNTAVGNKLSEKTGMNLNKGLSFAGLDTKSTDGGWLGLQARKAEKDDKYGKSLGYDEHKYKDEEGKIGKEKEKQTKYADIKQDLANKIRLMKEEQKLLPEKSKEREDKQKEITELQKRSNIAEQNSRAFDKGGVIYSMNSKGEFLDKDGKVTTDKSAAKTENHIGIQTMEKNKERIKTARENEWKSTLRKRSGKRFAADERDELGSIKGFGKEITQKYIDDTKKTYKEKMDKITDIESDIVEFEKKVKSSDPLVNTPENRSQLNELKTELAQVYKDADKKLNQIRKAESAIVKTNLEGVKQVLKEFGEGFAKGSGLVAAGAAGAGIINEGFAPGSTLIAAGLVGGLQGLRQVFEYSGVTNQSHADGHIPHYHGGHTTYHEPSGGSHDTPAAGGGGGGGGGHDNHSHGH